MSWATGFGVLHCFGLEGTGSYGVGLARHLRTQSLEVIEVVRPNRQTRRRAGKTDAVDAEIAARVVQSGTVLGEPKTADGSVEMIRTLRIARRSAMKARTQTANQLRAVLVTAPQQLRDRLRKLSMAQLVVTAARMRPGAITSPEAACKLALKSLATRYQQLSTEIDALDGQIAELAKQAAPDLVAIKGVGTDIAAALLGPPEKTPNACDRKEHSRTSAASHRSPHPPARPTATGSTVAETGTSTGLCICSRLVV